MTYVIAGMTAELWVIVVLSCIVFGMFADQIFVWRNRRNLFRRDMKEHMSRISQMLQYLTQWSSKMSAEMDALEVTVTDIDTVVKSAVALINGIAARIDAAGVDKVKLSALTGELRSDASDLATAVAANTPAETPPV